MTMLIKNDKKNKKQRFQIFYACLEPLEMDMFLPPRPSENKGKIYVWKWVGSQTWRGKEAS